MTSCMAWDIENEAGGDEDFPQLLTRAIITGCVNTTIYPSSCGSSCNVTFYRAGNTYGITLASGRVYGVYGLTNLPTSIYFISTNLAPNGTVVVGGFPVATPRLFITGVSGAQFFSTTERMTTYTPIGITGAVTASSAITFGVSNVGDISTVTIAHIINNAGIPVTMSRPGSGAITVNLCAPK
ncbi:unnamed protein product [Rotaria socialis]|uniref:Uncharacterized protein n=1 Tax=Rotaria socialis TaxID=392032 RepID=A0A818CPJ5_9BILA|nr:unnamed protein product [Rotaria socialis]CAF4876516.1 unnamed protein product [Rotaria socialis]